MTDKRKAKILLTSALALGGAAGYALYLRPRMLRWGATPEQARQPFPGDSLVPAPNYQSTHAVLIRAAAGDVWPWIVQIGYQRGGFYSYDGLERRVGLVGLHSAGEIVPDWQHIQVGDSIHIAPDTPMQVAVLEAERALVLHTVMNLFTAQVIDPAQPPGSPAIDWSWAFVLEPLGPALTRLVIRVRGNLQPQPLGRLLAWLALEPVHFIMERKMLQGMRERAEAQRPGRMLLDNLLPEYDFNEVHQMRVHAPAGRAYQALKALRPEELSPLIFAMLALRGLPAALARKAGRQATQPQTDKTFLEQLYSGGFMPLADDPEQKELVFGTIGQFWKLSGGQDVKLDSPQAFRAYQETDFAKVAANLQVLDLGEACVLSTETRIWAPDEQTRQKFAAYWRLISLGSGWIRVLWLQAIKRKAEN